MLCLVILVLFYFYIEGIKPKELRGMLMNMRHSPLIRNIMCIVRTFRYHSTDTSLDSAPILFYSRIKGIYRVFSNFHSCHFDFDGKSWPSSEHAFQAMKFSYDGASEENLVQVRATNYAIWGCIFFLYLVDKREDALKYSMRPPFW